MKLLYALVLLFCLIAVGYSEQIKNTNQVRNINNDLPMQTKAPWFYKQHNPEDFIKFLEEVLISVENEINPGNSTECVKTITNGTHTLVTLKPGDPKNYGIAFQTIIKITEKCGFEKLLLKFANDINFIVVNGPVAFAERQLEAFKHQSTNLIDCFEKVLSLSESKELQSEQLGKCLSIVIMDPILG
ncbi:hypothetical protein ACTFIY_003034 [Dictyostelium cf. discoideum]